MRLTDVAINSFNFSPGLKGPTVRALAQFTFDEFQQPQIVWIDLRPAEVQAIVSVARAVEHRFLVGETPLPEEVKRHSIGFEPPDKDKPSA